MARTAKPKIAGANTAPPARPKSNVTDETITKHVNACSQKKNALESAQGEYRAALKSAKAEGVSTSAIVWFLGARKRDVEDIDRETVERTRIAKVMGLPIGTQLGIFSHGVSAATAVENELFDAEQQGKYAYKVGVGMNDNPCPPSSPDFDAWMRGWTGERSKVANDVGEALSPPSKPGLDAEGRVL